MKARPVAIRHRILISLFWLPLLLLAAGLGLGLLPSSAEAWPRWRYIGLALAIFGVWYFDRSLSALAEWLELHTSKWPRLNVLVVLLGPLLSFALAAATIWGVLVGLERHIALASLSSIALAITLGSSGLEAWAFETPAIGNALFLICAIAAGIAGGLHGHIATGVLFGATWYITATWTDKYLELEWTYAEWLTMATVVISLFAASADKSASADQFSTMVASQAAFGAGITLLVSNTIYTQITKNKPPQ